MVRLYIENNEIELTNDVQVAITKQFEELSNPTTIINDWSKTVSLPFTTQNNNVFGHIYNEDRIIVEKPEEPQNLIPNLPIVSVEKAVWDGTYNMLTSTRTQNTNPNSNSFKVQKYNTTTYVGQLQLNCATCVRKDYITFTKDSTWNRLRIAFNGNIEDCYVDFNCSGLANGTYTLTYEVTALNRTTTGNAACVSGLYLVSGSTPVYAKTDVLPNLNYTTYNANYSRGTQTITSTATGNTTFVVQLFNGSSLYSTPKTQTSTGRGYVTITKNANWNRCFIGFDGHTNGIYLDFSNFAATDSFTISYYVTALGNTSGIVSNIVIVPSHTAVYWGELHPVESFTGVYFNPLRKLNFRLEWDDSVVMTGYAKMNEVKQTAGKGTYEVTLFGELGKVFGEMKKITFDTSTDDTDYLIDGKKFVEEYITKDLVTSSWNSTGQTQSTLIKKGLNNYSVTDIIGFAPNNAFSEEFDYKTVQMSTASSQLFTDVLGETFTTNTGAEPDTAIPDGMLPREFGEYRSYLQLPWIYFNKLFQVFQDKAESVTGYQFKLDSDWFNTSNPYWYNLVYMLKPFDLKGEEKVTNRYDNSNYSINWGGTAASGWTTQQTTTISFNPSSTEIVPIVDYTTNIINLSDDYDVLINTEYELELNQNRYQDLRIYPLNGINYQIRVTDVNGNVLDKIDGLIIDNDYPYSTAGYTTVLRCGQAGNVWKFYPQVSMLLSKGKYGSQVKLEFAAKWLNSNPPFVYNGSAFFPEYTISLYMNRGINNIKFNAEVVRNSHRSYSYFTLNSLWNKDFNLFNEILKYCKMYRICISVDEYNKVISFMPYNKYFTGYSVVDWTDKVDKSKGFTITPITFDNKYVLFNYEDSDTELGKSYKEKYGVNYGDYKLSTAYNFNNNTTELFEDVTPSIVNTDNVLSWTNLKNNNTIKYSFPAEISIYNKDKDKKQVDIFGAYFFHNGRATFSTESALYMRPVYITDDTIYQNASNGYFFIAANIESGSRSRVYYYPKLDIVNGNNLCIFNVPKDNYTYINNYSGKASIYSNFWKKYLEEKYNIQNKKITCYMMLKPTDYNQFKWNKLVKVNNQLCMVNKIYDYDVTNNKPTKVDLITIQDITGYTTNNYNA